MSFPFKQALVTGASSGIGHAIAARLASEGVEVTAVARRVLQVPEGTKGYACDLMDVKAVRELCEIIRKEEFDLVINVAGRGECAGFEAIDDATWDNNWQLMVGSPLLIMHAALPGLRTSRGALVNVSSLAAEFPLPYMSAYNTAKAALSALTISLMDEYPATTIIDLRPGDIRSEFAKDWDDDKLAKPWSATKKHMAQMMAEAPGPEVVVKRLISALRRRRSGTLRAGDFFQTAMAPLGTRLLPTRLLHALRRAYLKR